MFSSAAAGVSLTAAALVLVIGVSALIGFRGFQTAREAKPVEQRVVLSAPSADREAGSVTPVVIGGKARQRRATARKRSVASRRTKRTRASRNTKAPARSGLAAPGRKRAPARAPKPPQQQAPATTAPAPVPTAAPADPVAGLLDEVTGAVEDVRAVETVGDVLLDLRDVLP